MNEETLVGSLDDKLKEGEVETLIETPCKAKAKAVVDDSADKLLVVVPESIRKPGQNKGQDRSQCSHQLTIRGRA